MFDNRKDLHGAAADDEIEFELDERAERQRHAAKWQEGSEVFFTQDHGTTDEILALAADQNDETTIITSSANDALISQQDEAKIAAG